MNEQRAKQRPKDRPTLKAIVGLARDDKGLEFWLVDEQGQEYELHGQISFTYDRNWPDDLTQVAVVAFCDHRHKPDGWT